MSSDYLIRRRNLKLGTVVNEPKEKKPLKAISDKKAAQMKEEKKRTIPDEDGQLERWFKARRKEMVGTCQCGCGQKSQKKDDLYFRHSACHLFPKRLFPSIMYHPLNFLERAFFGGCHTNLDEGGMDKWPAMADWEDIKVRFHELAPLLTEEERATKFYRTLEELVYKN
jgi:hypothetical protein